MIPLQEKRTFETFGDENLKQKGFNIKQSGAAFKILSSGLYSDKVLAVIRELSANAWDAHNMADKEHIPFEVHLPNTFEPYYYVKDFGIGLSHKDVMNLYTTYFESTKSAENQSTGCFGLGSKSPFSYTDQFTVTSWHEGTKRVYTCAVDDQGLPSVTPLSTKKTNDVNGLEIRFAVDSNDFREFQTKSIDVYCHYAVKPSVIGNTCEIPEKTWLIESKTKSGIKFKLESNSQGYFMRSTVVQGACAYPVNKEAVENIIDNESIQGVYSSPFTITFPIGSLSITASREQIEYDKPTVANLQKVAKEILDVLKVDFQAQMDACNNLWEASILADELNRKSINMYKLLRDVVTYDGHTLHELNRKHFRAELKRDVKGNLRTVMTIKKVTRREADTYKRFTMHNQSDVNIQAQEGVTFVLDTSSVKQFNKVLEYNLLKSETSPLKATKRLYFVQFEEGEMKRAIKHLKDVFEGCEFVHFDDLEEPPKEVITSSMKAQKINTITKCTLSTYTGSFHMNPVEKIMEHGGIYVESHMKDYLGFRDKVSFTRFVDKAKSLGLINSGLPVFVIGATNKRALKNSKDKWTHVLDHVEKRLKNVVNNNDLKKAVSLERKKNVITGHYRTISILGRFSEHEPKLNTFYKKINAIKAEKGDEKQLEYARLANDVKMFKSKLQKDLTTSDKCSKNNLEIEKCPKLSAEFEALEAEYPLLFKFGMAGYSIHEEATKKEFIEYIKLINTKKKGN